MLEFITKVYYFSIIYFIDPLQLFAKSDIYATKEVTTLLLKRQNGEINFYIDKQPKLYEG